MNSCYLGPKSNVKPQVSADDVEMKTHPARRRGRWRIWPWGTWAWGRTAPTALEWRSRTGRERRERDWLRRYRWLSRINNRWPRWRDRQRDALINRHWYLCVICVCVMIEMNAHTWSLRLCISQRPEGSRWSWPSAASPHRTAASPERNTFIHELIKNTIYTDNRFYNEHLLNVIWIY